MDSRQETAANTPADPKPCRTGCGFFVSRTSSELEFDSCRSQHPLTPHPAHFTQGSNATGDCCPKCFSEPRTAAAAPPPPAPTAGPAAAAPLPTKKAPTKKASTKKARRTKRSHYRRLLAGAMAPSRPRDAAEDREGIRRTTGGGAFAKIDKI